MPILKFSANIRHIDPFLKTKILEQYIQLAKMYKT